MWKIDFLKYLQPVAGPHRRGRGCPFPYSIHCQNRCILVWRGKKRRCRMTEVVLTEQQPPLPIAVLTETLELAAKQRFLKELFPQPQRYRHFERAEAARSCGYVGL